MDKFIESLLLGYPIPGIILVLQPDKRYLVLDGQQRLRTLQAFYKGVHQDQEFSLKNTAEQFQGLTYATLSAEQRRQLDNTFIQATIVKAESTRESLEAVYQVFERMNSGGTQLTPHEIRIALYPGPFVDWLANLNTLQDWRHLYGLESPRLRDQELILRIVALFLNAEHYERPLKQFLNNFIGEHRDLQDIDHERVVKLFSRSVQLIYAAVGRSALRFQSNQVNMALTEALFVGLMRRLDSGRAVDEATVASSYQRLLADERLTAAISGSTSTEENLKARLEVATAIFSRPQRNS